METIRSSTAPPLTTHPLSPEDAGCFIQIEDATLSRFYRLLTDPVDLYGHVFAVLGDYGSGKTSLLNYVQASVYSDDILCMTIKNPPVAGQELDFWLYNGVLKRLRTAPRALSGERLDNLEVSPESILMLRDRSLSAHKYSGFIIFIDELHHVHDPKVACDFLKSKQGFLEDFVSAQSACFFLAGTLGWLDYLRQPAYQGIFDERIRLPSWTRAENAYELVYRRFKAAASGASFVFPFSKYDSFEKILAIRKSESPKGTPRFIVENTVKILDSPLLLAGHQQITGETISKLVPVASEEEDKFFHCLLE